MFERSDRERRGRGGMWVARCEILRMTVLKLNMSDSNTITIKGKSLEIHPYTHRREFVCIARHKVKIAERAICQKLHSERGGRGLIGLIEQDTVCMQSPIMRRRGCSSRLNSPCMCGGRTRGLCVCFLARKRKRV